MNLRFHVIESITNNFSEDQKVGSGGYSDVYKAVYNGKAIAVKKLRRLQGHEDKKFHNELINLTKVSHENVVRLIGYCYETRHELCENNGEFYFIESTERVLCFEYMERGSLETHIADVPCELDWPTCYNIIRGTCEGLNHLHSAPGNPIFHLDLKPANILLDKSMTPKIADLGLSRIFGSSESDITNIHIAGTPGYMPREYIDARIISNKFDVFSLGVIILKIVAGNTVYFRCSHMSPKGFIKLVSENWTKRLQAMPGLSSSHVIDILRVNTCAEIALRCVDEDPEKRPCIKDIVHELEELEDKIKYMSPYSDMSIDLVGQTSSTSKVLSVDPTIELRFLVEPRKDTSTCLQLTNKTDGFIEFRVITKQAKYCAQPAKGIMAPRSMLYMSVTLRAQDEAQLNMACNDLFVLQSARVSHGFEGTSDEITDCLFKEGMVDTMKLPIVYVAVEKFRLYSDHSEDLIGQEEINSMKSGQVPMLSYLTGSMNSLVDKLTEQKNGPMFGTLHEDLMTLKKDFDKLAGNGGVVVNPQVKVWIKQVREVVFDIEDWIDGKPEIMGDPTEREEKVKEFGTLIKDACSRCKRYDLFINLGADIAGLGFVPSKVVHIDSQLLLGDKACDIVGPKQMLKEHLLHQRKKLKVVSILGIGGLGKTTIAMELHGELQAEFPCGAFVYVGRNPSVRTILVNILHQSMSSSERKGYFKDRLKPSDDDFLPLHEREHEVILEKHLDEQQIIALLWRHLSKKRYLIVLDCILSIRHWRAISGALPDNNLGSRILTTTRIMDIAESCSPGRSNVVHHMKALSEVDSNRLFLGEKGKPADHEILKICGGIPLAIILAAAALKYQELVGPKMPGKSIFSSPNQYSTSEGMTNILHLIYADLSVPVRSCLLYLSLFPEGYTIKKNRLIQLWGAEGFITEEQLWRTGESYWNELISRRLIQPVFRHDDYEAVGCTVHGVILDFVRSLSREENFATMASELSSGSFLVDTIRRFSVDCSDEDEARVVASSRVHLSSIRSLTVFLPSYSPTENLVPASKLMRVMDLLPDFKLMRVLDLEDTRNLENLHLSGIGGFVLLRYMAIGGNGIDQLPEEIGKLMQLETLDLRLSRLPASIVNLENLMHLHLDMCFTGKGIFEISEELDKVAKLLRYWNRLRMLGLTMAARYLKRTVPWSMASLFEEVFRSNLESLYLHFPFGPDELLPLLVDSWKRVTRATVSRPRFLSRRFELIISDINLNGLPPKMASLLHLTHLRIKIYSMDQEVVRILGGLPKLLTLNLSSAYRPPYVRGCIITEDVFQCLKAGFFKGKMRLLFEKRAMPQLQMLSFHTTSKGHFYSGIEKLTCLKRVHAVLECYGATDSEIMTWEARIREQVARNPNKPALEFIRAYEKMTSYEQGFGYRSGNPVTGQ